MVYCVVRYGYILMEGNSSFKSELTTTIFCQLCISSSKTLVIQVDRIGIIPQDFFFFYGDMHSCVHSYSVYFFCFSLTIKKPSNLNEFTWVFVHLGAVLWRFLSVFFSLSLFSLCTFLIPPHVFCVCVCRGDLRLPFPAHLFSGVTVLRQWIGVFLWLLSVQSDTCPPPPGLCSVLLSLGLCGV